MQNKTTKRLTGKRLSAVASLVTEGLTVADIGCDHGWVPIYLVGEGIAPKAFAMDVRKGPLSIAEDHIRQAGLEDSIETRLSDGLAALAEYEAESIIIAGMGGPLIRRILTEGEAVAKSAKELILSPHSEWKECREYLLANGYEILTEQMVEEEGKYYLILKVRPMGEAQGYGDQIGDPDAALSYGDQIGDLDTALSYGEELLIRKDPVLKAYLLKEQATLTALLQRIGEAGTKRQTDTAPEVDSLHEADSVPEADMASENVEDSHGALRCCQIRRELQINQKALKTLGEEISYEVQ